MFWRSPEGQPAWTRPALLAVAVLAALLYTWNITSSGYALYYSNAVRSMSVSWKALLFGALDPAATITTDKIAGAFVPQALAVKVLGFHEWALTLPQCVEGVASVLVLYRVVRRWIGPEAGIAAAGLLAFTPVLASVFGHAMEDGALTFCLVMAADRYQCAVRDARPRSLAAAGIWIGLGFQMKMMQAWLIVPALAVGYLVAAPVRLRRRVAHTAVAGAACLAVSLAWVAMMTVVPAKDRPYVDGSTNNSAFAMVFGYNGLERFGIDVPGSAAEFGSRPPGAEPGGPPGAPAPGAPAPGAPAPGAPAPDAPPASAPGTATAPGALPPGDPAAAPAPGSAPAPAPGSGPAPGPAPAPGGPNQGPPGAAPGPGSEHSPWLKLFTRPLGPQIGWTYPLAALGLVLGLWWRRREPRTDHLRGGLVMWGTWLVTVGLVFSKMGSIPHTAYLATLAPALAALTAAGAVLMWRAHLAGGPRAWALPVAVAAEATWSWYLASFEPDFLPWLRPPVAVVCAVGVVAMVLARAGGRVRPKLLAGGAVVGLVGAVASPVAWSASVLDRQYAGTAFDATAGPSAILQEAEALQRRLSEMPPPAPAAPPPGGTANGPAPAPAPAPAPGDAPGARASAGRGLPPGGPLLNATATLNSSESKLYAYIKEHRNGAEYVLATDGWRTPFILATGDTVMPMGGFSGSVPHPTVDEFAGLVRDGRLRFVLLSGLDGIPVAGLGGSPGIRDWVRANCAVVPPESYGVNAAEARATTGLFGPTVLHHCPAPS